MPEDVYTHTLRGRWSTLAHLETAIQADPGATIRPRAATDRHQAALTLLDQIGADQARGRTFEVGETLGEGAMGVVRLATQTSLGRQVAVKTLKPGASTPRNLVHLLQEAWITGALEHPNVVPVYDVEIAADGAPQIVLKRIAGQSWGALLADPEAVRARARNDDVLGWHLRTLMQVCEAVHFAHSRGIIHRDLKPENVMIGAYGEVYVVDWGIAVSADAADGRLPRLADAHELAGTPCYMAPEMLGRDPDEPQRISAQSDVYLLGATLFHLLAGAPPHRGSSVFEMLANVLRSSPDFAALDAPEELRAVCARAMAREPGDRFADAAALRDAIQAFLDHRESIRLTAAAEAQMATLSASLADPAADRAARYRLFGECRFGFRSALSSWPQNLRAQAGLRAATERLARAELVAGNAKGAAAVLAELDPPPPALADEVAAALAAEAEASARLARLGRLHDRDVGRNRRFLLAVVVGAAFSLSPLVRALFFAQQDYLDLLGALIVFLALATAIVAGSRENVLQTALNKHIAGSVFVALLTLFAFDLGAVLLDIPVEKTVVFHMLIAAGMTFMTVLVIEWRIWVGAVAFGAAYALALRWPAQVLYFTAGANLVATVNALWVWRPRRAP